MRRLFLLLLVLPLLIAAGPALAEKRVALVIGNAAYESVPKLPNPTADADAMAKTLKDVGFEVILRKDLDQQNMASTLAEFTTALADADVGLFYYAGHAIQYDGQNYLVSTNAKLDNAFALNADTVALQQIVEAMQGASAINLVLLDACRNNPFVDRLKAALPKDRSVSVSRGLAPASVQKGDTMIVYATAANQTAADGAGDHSPFTQALLENIPTPGVEVSLLLKRVVQAVREKTLYQQSPEVLSAMAAEFYFNDATPITPTPSSKSLPVNADAYDFEKVTAAYKVALAADTAAAWRDFLQTYPSATLASFAQESLIKAEAREAKYDPAIAFEEREAALGLGGEERIAIQTTLNALGFGVGTPDGAFGQKTRQALLGFQFEKGLMPTGFVDAPTRARLQSEDVQAAAARQLQAADGLTGAAAERSMGLSPEEIRTIKLGLSAKGLPTDPAERMLGSTDRGSIKQLQFQAGGEPSGYLTGEMAAELLALGRRDGAQLARYVNASDLAANVDPRLMTAAARFHGRPIKYAYFGSTLYVAVLGDIDFDRAQDLLEGTGGHLAVFSSPAEKKFIDNLIRGDRRFFICEERWCNGPVLGYYQLASAKRATDGWVTVTGEPTGRLPWNKGQPNELFLAKSVGFVTYGNDGPNPLFELVDMIRFQQTGTSMVVEFSAQGAGLMTAKK